MRLVLDAKVLIAALLFGGKPREVLNRAIRGELHLYICESILTELGDVPRRPKFGFLATAMSQIITELTATGTLVRPRHRILEIEADEAGNRVLECALEANADYIVSGDGHLLDLGQYRSIRIVSPHGFLKLQRNSSLMSWKHSRVSWICPGRPCDSMRLAALTASPHTSYWNYRSPHARSRSGQVLGCSS